ncbi:MAG: hypothetical protein R2854_03985 [Caldilineaceae bacterium]
MRPSGWTTVVKSTGVGSTSTAPKAGMAVPPTLVTPAGAACGCGSSGFPNNVRKN